MISKKTFITAAKRPGGKPLTEVCILDVFYSFSPYQTNQKMRLFYLVPRGYDLHVLP